MTPGYALRRLVCALIGHDPFPRNPATRDAGAVRCWGCGDLVDPRRVKVRRR